MTVSNLHGEPPYQAESRVDQALLLGTTVCIAGYVFHRPHLANLCAGGALPNGCQYDGLDHTRFLDAIEASDNVQAQSWSRVSQEDCHVLAEDVYMAPAEDGMRRDYPLCDFHGRALAHADYP